MERDNPRQQLIDKFTNGQERYNNSPLFRNVIESILQGSNLIATIDSLITMNEDTDSRMKEYIEKGPAPFTIMQPCECKGFYKCTYCQRKQKARD